MTWEVSDADAVYTVAGDGAVIPCASLTAAHGLCSVLNGYVTALHGLNARVRRLEIQADGRCPDCDMKIRGWGMPHGAFAPDLWATLRDRGVDPASGHKQQCVNKGLRL